MSEFFLTVVNMSISASWIVLAVLVLRLLLKKAPKWISVLLWAIVAVRLVCPFAIESVMSLIPSVETISLEIMYDKTPEINTGVPVINGVINQAIEAFFTPTSGTSVNPLQVWIPVLAFVWGIGMHLLLVYTVVSYWRVTHKIKTAVLLSDNIYQSENVVSPFVLGIVKPRIYLPFHMNEQDVTHVVAHEQAHIRRKDHWWKPLGFMILTLHWFNPLMWLSYVLFCRDIELACDEKVVREFEPAQRADYSQALLACSVNRRMIAACPLAFGEVGVKDRVKMVLNYRKPAFWLIVTAIVASVVLAVCFLTNPISDMNNEYSWEDIVQGESIYPIQPGTEEWKELGTVQNKKDACRIPDDVLKEMTDGELIRAVLDYPFLMEIFLVQDYSIGARNVYNDCDALQELLSRRTGGKALSAFMEERTKVSPASGDEEFENDAIRTILEEFVY